MASRPEIPQAGIFALGTSSHAYLEFDLAAGADPEALVAGLAGLREPRMTIGGVNLVLGFRPELWRDALGAPAPEDLDGFVEAISGSDDSAVSPGHRIVTCSARW